jgi:hypothetical protein
MQGVTAGTAAVFRCGVATCVQAASGMANCACRDQGDGPQGQGSKKSPVQLFEAKKVQATELRCRLESGRREEACLLARLADAERRWKEAHERVAVEESEDAATYNQELEGYWKGTADELKKQIEVVNNGSQQLTVIQYPQCAILPPFYTLSNAS